MANVARDRRNLYTSVLLRDGLPPTDLLAGTGSYLSTAGVATGWRLDNHWFPSTSYHFGRGTIIWLVTPIPFRIATSA
jgi:hypothetical protein